MLKPLLIIFCFCVINNASAQTAAVQSPPEIKGAQPYGQVDMADLEMKQCDFESDANAEVLFDVGNIKTSTFERHVRIKIFNDFGKDAASIRLPAGPFGSQTEVKGETFNLVNGKIEITELDKKTIYDSDNGGLRPYIAFALPNIKAGSIIEFKVKTSFYGVWEFQSNLPTRYSEIKTDFPGGVRFKFIPHVKQPFVKNVGAATDFTQIKALANVHSLPDEVFMSSRENNLQRIEYIGVNATYPTWSSIAELLISYFNREQKIDGHISGERDIINQAKALKTADEKIAFIFQTVKSNLNWNKKDGFIPEKGAEKVWTDKTGNNGEINWIVYHLLKKTGIPVYPMIVSLKEYGKLNPLIPNLYQLINLVVYSPLDTNKVYVLDATNKYNLYNKVPINDLNTFGLNIDEDSKLYKALFLQDEAPAIQSVFINADILPNSKMKGNAEINSFSYHKINSLTKYHSDKEEYIKYLANNDNSIQISSLKLEGADIDSIPLTQKFDFNIDLTSSDENYIYFKTNLFGLPAENPFVKEERYSDIDFGYRDNYRINSIYKIPEGYKSNSLPKSVTLVMPDESITFKRIVVENEDTILVKYSLNHKKTIYFAEDYQDIRGFYKKMYDLLNEQIVLKKQ